MVAHVEIEPGYCKCGCGQKTQVCVWPHPERGHVKGKPLPYIRFHKRRRHPLVPKYTVSAGIGCWLWDGAVDDKGYGRYYAGRKKWLAHVFMYTRAKGKPGGMLDHVCLNKRCVNPDHLRLATRSQNSSYRPKQTGKRRYSSEFKGVAKARNRWKAYICLGTFDTEVEAAEAYNVAARQIFKEFAYLNSV